MGKLTTAQLEYHRSYRARNKDKIKQWRKDDWYRNRSKRLAYNSIYNTTISTFDHSTYSKAHRKANPALYAYYRRQRRANCRAQDPDATIAWAEILSNDPCSYCGAPCEHIDHIEAVAKGGSGEWDNLTASCAECNLSKKTESLLLFLKRRLNHG